MSLQVIKKAVTHFIDFHQGGVNIATHAIGFCLLFYSIYVLDWRLFALSILVLESGHVYNHLIGLRPYNFKLSILLWRGFLFMILVATFYLVTWLMS